MRTLLLIILLSSSLLSLPSCKPFQKASYSGTLVVQLRRYDTATNQYTMPTLIPDLKLWYKDSMAIEEIRTVKINTVDSVTKIETPVAYYVFIDLPTRSFYHYSSFSDTATLLESYAQGDSAQIRGLGGWPFYRNIDLNFVGKPEPLKDTTIRGIRLKRWKFTQLNNGTYSHLIGYFRCDRKGTLFLFYKSLSQQIGCPMVRTDFLPGPGDHQPISSEINFLTNRLGSYEVKVFEEWKRRAMEKPATQ